MGWIEDYMEYARNNEAPDQFHWWTSLAVLGATLRRNVVFRKGSFKIFPNPWILIVAPSGTKKSTALELGFNLLSKMDNIRILPNKFTPEVLLRSLARPERGSDVIESQAVLYSSEFGVVLDRKHYNEGLTQLLLDLWDSRDQWRCETVGGGIITLRNIAIVLLAAIADDIFRESMPELALRSGFLARLILVTGKDEGKIEAFPWTDENLEAELLSQLYELSMIRGEMGFEDGAEEWYITWYMKHKARIRTGISEAMKAYYERKPRHLLQVAMLCAISQKKRPVYTVRSFEEAAERLDALEPGMEALLNAISAPPFARIQARILEQIKATKLISHKELLKKNMSHIADPAMFKKAMMQLLETGMLDVMRDKRGTIYYRMKGGR